MSLCNSRIEWDSDKDKVFGELSSVFYASHVSRRPIYSAYDVFKHGPNKEGISVTWV